MAMVETDIICGARTPTGPKTLRGRMMSAKNIGKDYFVLLAVKQARLGMRPDDGLPI